MTTAKHRNAWIWLAVVAMSIAVSAQAQSGVRNARAYATPVLQFLAAHSLDQQVAADAQRLLHRRSARADRNGSDTGVLAAMLPVFFVGLVSPLNLVSPCGRHSISRAPAAPALPSSFQRPPPQLL